MLKTMAEMEAIPVSLPHITTVMNPATLQEDEHLGYTAEIQYKRKPPANRLIMCSQLDTVNLGEPVMISYHSGMRCYQHSRHISVSNEYNCVGGFYYTNGSEAWAYL